MRSKRRFKFLGRAFIIPANSSMSDVWVSLSVSRIAHTASKRRITWRGSRVCRLVLLRFDGGLALLGGAATVPTYRSRKIYSTLLRRRLEDARAHGYHVSAIYAGPMSRRVVGRYGFKEYARSQIYGWMPEIDMEVIRSLVPND